MGMNSLITLQKQLSYDSCYCKVILKSFTQPCSKIYTSMFCVYIVCVWLCVCSRAWGVQQVSAWESGWRGGWKATGDGGGSASLWVWDRRHSVTWRVGLLVGGDRRAGERGKNPVAEVAGAREDLLNCDNHAVLACLSKYSVSPGVFSCPFPCNKVPLQQWEFPWCAAAASESVNVLAACLS